MKNTRRFHEVPSRLLLLVLFTMALWPSVMAQNIRKNYRELTTQEKTNYVNALNALYVSAPNIMEQYVAFHRAPSSGGFSQHGNDDFLTWHRIYLYYMEKEMRAINPKVNLVYWDWTYSGDWSSSSPLFSDGSGGRVGLFGLPLNATWKSTISRPFGESDPQPSASNLASLVSIPNYTNFRGTLEGSPHGTAHCWIGFTGTMCNITLSPRDPVFYTHHSMVDKVFQDWTNAQWNGGTISTLSTNLPTITGKPNVNGNAIIDSRALKVWYASNGNVTLDKYTVSHTTLGVTTGPESYAYTGGISVAGSSSNYFTVPANTSCTMTSATSITLNSGFIADVGSSFLANIDVATFNSPRMEMENEEQVPSMEIAEETTLFFVFPNPSNGVFNVTVPTSVQKFDYELLDATGKLVSSKSNVTDQMLYLDLSEEKTGIYLLRILPENGTSVTKVLNKY